VASLYSSLGVIDEYKSAFGWGLSVSDGINNKAGSCRLYLLSDD
jgi:hypothetical protein